MRNHTKREKAKLWRNENGDNVMGESERLRKSRDEATERLKQALPKMAEVSLKFIEAHMLAKRTQGETK